MHANRRQALVILHKELVRNSVHSPSNVRSSEVQNQDSSLVTKSVLIFINIEAIRASLVCVSVQFWRYN